MTEWLSAARVVLIVATSVNLVALLAAFAYQRTRGRRS